MPPTDSRLRPDQRFLENGEYDMADTEKLRLEQRQREVMEIVISSSLTFKLAWCHLRLVRLSVLSLLHTYIRKASFTQKLVKQPTLSFGL